MTAAVCIFRTNYFHVNSFCKNITFVDPFPTADVIENTQTIIGVSYSTLLGCYAALFGCYRPFGTAYRFHLERPSSTRTAL